MQEFLQTLAGVSLSHSALSGLSDAIHN